jgi:hypothetical protein
VLLQSRCEDAIAPPPSRNGRVLFLRLQTWSWELGLGLGLGLSLSLRHALVNWWMANGGTWHGGPWPLAGGSWQEFRI